MANKRRYSFAEKNDSKGGRLAVGLGITALILGLLIIFFSVLAEGSAAPFVGALAISGALFSIYGFYLGMTSFGEKNTSPKYSIIGSILCGVIMIGYLTMFLMGIRS